MGVCYVCTRVPCICGVPQSDPDMCECGFKKEDHIPAYVSGRTRWEPTKKFWRCPMIGPSMTTVLFTPKKVA